MSQLKFALRFVFFAAMFVGVSWFLFSLKKQPVIQTPGIVVTVNPIFDIVRQVAGPSIAVGRIVPSGANPHTYEPPPSALRGLASAKVIFAIGHGLDDWVDTIVADTAARKVVVDAGIRLRQPIDSPFGDAEEAAGGADPHYWLTMRNAKRIAVTVERELAAAYPERKAELRANLERYSAELDAADQKMHDMLAGVANKKMVALHDAWYYFAETYGLEIVGTFEPSAGREPTPQYLSALSDAVAVSGARVLYAEHGAPVNGLESFVKDHGLAIVTLDPVEGATGRSYIQTMLDNAKIIRAHQ